MQLNVYIFFGWVNIFCYVFFFKEKVKKRKSAYDNTDNICRFNNEEVPADEEDLLKNLSLASESVWLQLFVIMVVAVTCVFVIINMIGCAGTCLLSYSLLSGFTIFMMLSSILAVTVACSLLLPLHSSKMDSPLAPLVNQD